LALTGQLPDREQQALAAIAEQAGQQIPAAIAGLFDKPVVQKTLIDKTEVEAEILRLF
ncbi:MAG: threonine synthase, partial [Gammaproteobacteria bacterium]|nr:threonine synthase [Gammaproteobacteria bacterium]